MTISPQKNPKVDAFIDRATAWQAEMGRLREIVLDTDLTEIVKWGKPCYAFDDHNVVIMQPFNESLALMFFKGALLKDDENVLIKFGTNTRAARRLEFTSVQEVDRMAPILKAYIDEAIEVEKSGVKVDFEEGRELPVPEELQRQLEKNPVLREAFTGLTPGRQRGYILHISSAKQSRTREERVEKLSPRILEGLGLRD